jgi:hypothetical protein
MHGSKIKLKWSNNIKTDPKDKSVEGNNVSTCLMMRLTGGLL